MKFTMTEVPPPKEVPVHQIAETIGLLPGLTAHKDSGGWRCDNCGRMQAGKSVWIVWVPDGVSITDSAENISEACRQSAYNGSGSGWCLKCAKALGHPTMSVVRRLMGALHR